MLALVLAASYERDGSADGRLPDAWPSSLGLGTGAVFKLVPEWFPDQVGAVTGVVGAAGGLGGFFPPLVMALVKSATGAYALGFVLMAAVAAIALIVLRSVGRSSPAPVGGTASIPQGRVA